MDAYAPGSPQGDDGFGLFNTDNSPKPAATAIHNLTALLASQATAATNAQPSSPDYSLSGPPASGQSMVISNADGTFDIAIWNEPQIWDSSTQTEITPAGVPITVQLGGTYRSVSIYDPMTGTTPIQTLSNVSSVALSIADHPLILKLGNAVPSSSRPITVGTGQDSLSLKMSEQAFDGDAQFTIAVDGTQVGGVQTATASQAAGQTQVFNVLGNFAPGSHTASIRFLNDKWVPGVGDRNLYVNGASIDGNAIASTSLQLNSAGTKSFKFTGPSPASAVAATIGAGPDVLALKISEQAFDGDAQFTVAVDGKTIGGTLTTTANHAAGQDQIFDVLGVFGSGPHVASISFLNDKWVPGVGDRNLFVDSAGINGATINASSVEIGKNMTKSFGFGSWQA